MKLQFNRPKGPVKYRIRISTNVADFPAELPISTGQWHHTTRAGHWLVGMRLSCNFVNVYTKLTCERLLNVYINLAANNKMQIVLGRDKYVIVSNGKQPPVTSARQPLMKFIHLIVA